MSYLQLEINPEISKNLKNFITKNIENNYLKDIHTMLRLPMPDQGMNAGLNFSIATILFSVIAGCSVVFLNQQDIRESGKNFKKLVERNFPWKEEPEKDKVPPAHAARIIYETLRNPLVHNAAKLDFDTMKEVFPGKGTIVALKVERSFPGMDELAIEKLETDIRPNGLSGTITKNKRANGDAILLNVEGLYWCVRKMIKQLTYDGERVKDAAAWLKRQSM